LCSFSTARQARALKTPLGKLMAAGGIEAIEYQAAEQAIEEVQRE
jgi:hypothetical protein